MCLSSGINIRGCGLGVTEASMAMDVGRRLRLLKTMNPAVVTREAAVECNWAAEMIELMGAYLAAAEATGDVNFIRDQRVKSVINWVRGIRQ